MTKTVLVACSMSREFHAKASELFVVREGTPFQPGETSGDPDASAVLVRSDSTVTSDHIVSMPNLELILRVGAGIDNIDTAAARAHGVSIQTIPGVNAPDVAELAVGLLIHLSRRLWLLPMRRSSENRTPFLGTRLRDRTLGILGCGTIGSLVGDIAIAMGMGVVATVAQRTPERDRKLGRRGFRVAELDDMLLVADDLIVALPSDETTNGLLNTNRVTTLRQGASVVVVGRSATVDLAALIDRLRRGELNGVAVDEYTLNHGNIEGFVATPHIGGVTRAADEARTAATLAALERALGT